MDFENNVVVFGLPGTQNDRESRLQLEQPRECVALTLDFLEHCNLV